MSGLSKTPLVATEHGAIHSTIIPKKTFIDLTESSQTETLSTIVDSQSEASQELPIFRDTWSSLMENDSQELKGLSDKELTLSPPKVPLTRTENIARRRIRPTPLPFAEANPLFSQSSESSLQELDAVQVCSFFVLKVLFSMIFRSALTRRTRKCPSG